MHVQLNSYDPFNAVVKNLMLDNESDEIIVDLGTDLTDHISSKSEQPMGRNVPWTDVRVMKKYL